MFCNSSRLLRSCHDHQVVYQCEQVERGPKCDSLVAPKICRPSLLGYVPRTEGIEESVSKQWQFRVGQIDQATKIENKDDRDVHRVRSDQQDPKKNDDWELNDCVCSEFVSSHVSHRGCCVRRSNRLQNGTDHGDRAVESGFRTEDAEVSRASDGSAVVLLEAAFGLAGGSTPAPPGYPTASDRATFRPREVSSMGIGPAKRPANHARPRRKPICDQIR